ncbi:MAG: hypothetical protein AUG45_13580 [Ktedonobacter sp. 13_1_20CM_3_54_15]|nr:MAG: hypothetical protein AUG45_13580 [Ktedonobacter sp. 13_1_20CM_3_54_15]
MTVSKTPHMTDYEAERRNFHLEVPAQFNFAIDVIGKWAADPSKPAMLWIGEHGEEKGLTFAYFAERSSRAANAFTALGIKKGDRILVMLPRMRHRALSQIVKGRPSSTRYAKTVLPLRIRF